MDTALNHNQQDCEVIRDTLFALCDDAAFTWESPAERETYEAHMAGCADCQQYERQMANSIRALRSLGDSTSVALPDAELLADRIVAHTTERANKGASFSNRPGMPLAWRRWGAVAAAITLLLVSFPMLSRYMDNTSQPVAQHQALSANNASAASDTALLANGSSLLGNELTPFAAASTSTADNSISNDPISVLVDL